MGEHRLTEMWAEIAFQRLSCGVNAILSSDKSQERIHKYSGDILTRLARVFRLGSDNVHRPSTLSPKWLMSGLVKNIQMIVAHFTDERLPDHQRDLGSDIVYLTALHRAKQRFVMQCN